MDEFLVRILDIVSFVVFFAVFFTISMDGVFKELKQLKDIQTWNPEFIFRLCMSRILVILSIAVFVGSAIFLLPEKPGFTFQVLSMWSITIFIGVGATYAIVKGIVRVRKCLHPENNPCPF
jgi:hypothetical protein